MRRREVSPPTSLPAIDAGGWINFGFDPRDVEAEWLEDVLRSAPAPIKRTPLSFNEADAQSVLIIVGVLFAAIIFKPFVTTVATEAGKVFLRGC